MSVCGLVAATGTPASASSLSSARTTCTWCRSSRTSTRSLWMGTRAEGVLHLIDGALAHLVEPLHEPASGAPIIDLRDQVVNCQLCTQVRHSRRQRVEEVHPV